MNPTMLNDDMAESDARAQEAKSCAESAEK